MAFDTLPETIQNIHLEYFNFFFKLTLILIFLTIAILIVTKFKPKESKYLMVSKIRLTYYIISWAIITTFPFQLGFLSPKVPTSALLNPLITFYTVNFAVLGIILILNILRYGSGFVTELFGESDPEYNKVKNEIKRYLK